jgi:mono/diheme cytochrome c family protein
MGKYGYFLGVALVVIAVLVFGLLANTPRGEDPRAASVYPRGHLPSDGLAANFDLATVDRSASTSAGIGYPPRALGLAVQRKAPSDSWLLDADSDRERFRRIEVALRGLDIHMAEIGVRFRVMHDAIERGNLPLASLEIDKTIETAQLAMLKRPGFAGDEGLRYMGAPAWTALDREVKTGDAVQARAAFLQVRQSCMACHTSRGLGFINDSELFDSTATFGGAVAAATPASSPVTRQPQGSVR